MAENWVQVAVVAPHHGEPARFAKALGFDEYQPWMKNLESKDVRNGALVAIDYQTGELIAHVGSAELLLGDRTTPSSSPSSTS